MIAKIISIIFHLLLHSLSIMLSTVYTALIQFSYIYTLHHTKLKLSVHNMSVQHLWQETHQRLYTSTSYINLSC
jgi:hypothetical protein